MENRLFQIIVIRSHKLSNVKERLLLCFIPSWFLVWHRELMKKALPILVSILEKEARGWFLHFREKVIADLKAQNLSDYEVEKVPSHFYIHSVLFIQT